MAIETAQGGVASSGHALRRAVIGAAAVLLAAIVVLAVLALTMSGASLSGDSSALAHVSVQPLGGSIQQVEAFGPNGRRVPIAVHGSLLTPLQRLHPGEQITIAVRVRRPGWLGWALGSEHTEHLTMTTPVASVSERWMTVHPGAPVRVAFDQPVSAVSWATAGTLSAHPLREPTGTVSLGHQPPTGTVAIAAAPRAWETVGAPMRVSWFPDSSSPVLAVSPAPGSAIGPATPLYLTFSRPVSEVVGSSRPTITPATYGHWSQPDSHTLEFRPGGFGAPLGARLTVTLPKQVAVASTTGAALSKGREVSWVVPPGSTVRLHQLLAQAGYLPVAWHASGHEVAHTPQAEAQAATTPPAGSFDWRYPNTPHQLRAMWSPSAATVITRGAVMKFENENGLTADGVAGAGVWRSLMAYAIAGKKLHEGYSYVYVHRETPETATLWSAGHTVISAPANTGIAGAETALGTYPVFEHIPEGTMSGTNPDGSHYKDPGIKWISYFNGGDALHNFDRASFGTPQSLGCVELPLAASAEIWKYTPIGTLVTVET